MDEIRISGKQWDRVHGPNLQPYHKERYEAAKNRMKSDEFKSACANAGIEPTRRQARKWNMRKGAAYKHSNFIEMNGFMPAN